MEEKRFDEWNIRQKELDAFANERLFSERDIWWCALGVNIGTEQDGKNELFERPVIVVKKFSLNSLLIVPVTSSAKANYNQIKLSGVYDGSNFKTNSSGAGRLNAPRALFPE